MVLPPYVCDSRLGSRGGTCPCDRHHHRHIWIQEEEEEEEEVRASKEEGNKVSSVTAELQLRAERNWKDDVTECLFLLLPSDIQKTKTNAQDFQPALESTGTTQR